MNAYPNLKAEMARHNISLQSLADTIGRTKRCISKRLAGESPFTVEEAIKIQEQLFKGCSIQYLFKRGEQDA